MIKSQRQPNHRISSFYVDIFCRNPSLTEQRIYSCDFERTAKIDDKAFQCVIFVRIFRMIGYVETIMRDAFCLGRLIHTDDVFDVFLGDILPFGFL
jgi:hypothetical protein